MEKKIIISAVSVGLALAVIGASVGTYMSYIKNMFPLPLLQHLLAQNRTVRKNLLKMQIFMYL